MHLIDTHCHLYAEDFNHDLDAVMQRAIISNVKTIIMPNVDSLSIDKMVSICQKYNTNCAMMLGLHPTYVKSETYKAELDIIASSLTKHSFCAIGEIGLDLHWDKSTLAIQEEALRYQLDLAAKHQLPVALHTRAATAETIAILADYPMLNGVFHCFVDDMATANKIIDMGFYLGLGGVITNKNSSLKDFLGSLPLDSIILETDAPYLAPVPYRGKRNEPSYISLIAHTLAIAKNIDIEDIATITTRNAINLFKLATSNQGHV